MRTHSRIALCLVIALGAGSRGRVGAAPAAGAIVSNGSFEQLEDGKPQAWRAWQPVKQASGPCEVVRYPDAPSGEHVAMIVPEKPQWTSWSQGVADQPQATQRNVGKRLTPGRWYELSAMVKCEDLKGQGVFVEFEYWRNGVAYGSIDSEHLVGTQDWTRLSVRFQAPAASYDGCSIGVMQCGGPGKIWIDDVQVVETDTPTADISARRVLDKPYWGMFTCFSEHMHTYGKDMKDAGVYWQRMGGGCSAPEQQKLARSLGMAFEFCLDGMPGAYRADDSCYPVTTSDHYLGYLNGYLNKDMPATRIWEVFNEPNRNVNWSLPAYANLLKLVGPAIKEKHPNAIFATGGLGIPSAGYAASLLRRGVGDVVDIILVHPYQVDEALDAYLYALTDACRRYGHPDLPIGINETGWPTWDPASGYGNLSQFVSEAEQARNVVKMYVQGLAHRLSLVTYLGWNDLSKHKSDQAMNMGLVRVDGSRKPSYRAFRFMTRTIGSRRQVEWTVDDHGTRVYRIEDEDLPPVWVTWNALREARASVDVGERKVFPCDVYGAKLTVRPISGRAVVDVGDEPVYLVPAE